MLAFTPYIKRIVAMLSNIGTMSEIKMTGSMATGGGMVRAAGAVNQNIGTGDFTFRCKVYVPEYNAGGDTTPYATGRILVQRINSAFGVGTEHGFYITGNKLGYYTGTRGTSYRMMRSSSIIPLGVSDIVIMRKAGVLTGYINGVQTTFYTHYSEGSLSAHDNLTMPTTTPWYVGGDWATNRVGPTSYISNVKLSTIAEYSGATFNSSGVEYMNVSDLSKIIILMPLDGSVNVRGNPVDNSANPNDMLFMGAVPRTFNPANDAFSAVSVIPYLTSNSSSGYTVTYKSLWSNPSYWQGYFPFTQNMAEGAIENGFSAGDAVDGNWIQIHATNAGNLIPNFSKIGIQMPPKTLETADHYGKMKTIRVEGSNDNFASHRVTIKDIDYGSAVPEYTEPTSKRRWFTFDVGQVSGYRAIRLTLQDQEIAPKWGNMTLYRIKFFG